MTITTSTVSMLTITDLPRLDPIRVITENYGAGQGRIIITCLAQAWCCYWGAMRDSTVEEFFARCNVGYLAGNLSTIKSSVFDSAAAENACRKHVLQERWERAIDKDRASDLYDQLDYIDWISGGEIVSDTCAEMFSDIFGDDWWHSLPEKPNPKWEYLIRIVEAVQAALAQQLAEVAP